MKKLIVLALALVIAHVASAQQKSTTNYMSVSIFQQGNHIDYVVVTRTDSAQMVKNVKIKVRTASDQKALTDGDAALMQLLSPYFNQGWKLLSFAVGNEIFSGNNYSQTFRYYLSKDVK